MTSGDTPVEVGRYTWRHQAEMRRDLLAGEGVRAVVVADDAGGAYAGIAPARLLVAAGDLDLARALLAAFEAEGEGTAEAEA